MRTSYLAFVPAALLLSAASQAQWFGQDVIDRDYVDFAYQITFLDPANAAPSDGYVTGWRLYAKDPGDVILQVFRPVATGYQLIGQNPVTISGVGFYEIPVAPVDQIAIQTGDILGFRYNGWVNESQVIAMTFGSGAQQWTAWPDASTDVPVGGVLPTSKLSGYGENRGYSLAAKVEAVPEPATILALSAGVAAFARRRRRS